MRFLSTFWSALLNYPIYEQNQSLPMLNRNGFSNDFVCNRSITILLRLISWTRHTFNLGKCPQLDKESAVHEWNNFSEVLHAKCTRTGRGTTSPEVGAILNTFSESKIGKNLCGHCVRILAFERFGFYPKITSESNAIPFAPKVQLSKIKWYTFSSIQRNWGKFIPFLKVEFSVQKV